jgi:5'-nucleotidase
MKYLGRLDLVLSDDPTHLSQATIGDASFDQYDPIDRFEVVSYRYTLFPVDSSVPEEPTMAQLLEPYAVALDRLANLDNLIGYSPNGVSRTNTNGGDSPMGNLVTTAMQRRLGVQTDFALTNTLGIRDSIPPGPVSVDQIFNVFPFDNSITTLQLSGSEVLEMFDFIARRSSGRGCNSQAQISGTRVVLACGGCDRDGVPGPDLGTDGQPLTACAQTVNIGLRADNADCTNDDQCNPNPNTAPQARSLCDPLAHKCMDPLHVYGSYSLAANDYIAAGGSGFFVLQRNTTQVNTGVQLRDALVDFVQNGNPCGYDPSVASTYRSNHPDAAQHGDDGLTICNSDTDCGSGFVCSCPDRFSYDDQMHVCSGATSTDPQRAVCTGETGRCVLQACRDDVANQVIQHCPSVDPPNDPGEVDRCRCNASNRAGETCRILSCFDETVGAVADGRLHMETVQ